MHTHAHRHAHPCRLFPSRLTYPPSYQADLRASADLMDDGPYDPPLRYFYCQSRKPNNCFYMITSCTGT